MVPLAARLGGTGDFFRTIGLLEHEGAFFDPEGNPLVVAEGEAIPGAVLLWPGTPGVFYDLEGNLHLTGPAPAKTPGKGPRLLGVLYSVVDLTESIAWYQDRGLALAFFDPASDWAELRGREGLSVLLTFDPGSERRGILVFEVEDARAWVKAVRIRGLTPAWTRRTGWGRLAAYAGPQASPVLFIDRSGND